MSFADFSPMPPGVQLLQRSLERGRLGHAYLFLGDELEKLEGIARTLAKVLNCLQPVSVGKAATDSSHSFATRPWAEHGRTASQVERCLTRGPRRCRHAPTRP